MFTGIVSATGHIVAHVHLSTQTTLAAADSSGHGLSVTVQTPAGYLADVGLGDSIAVNGACMTVTCIDLALHRFDVDVSRESLNKTCGLDQLGLVNLEKALRANDRLGGHLVSGHVDGIGKVAQFQPLGESWHLEVLCPPELARFMAYKGSITVNGVSLTVNQIKDQADGCLVSINLIPHTVENTALRVLIPGASVNLEIDLIARYVERMLGVASTIPNQ
jgi:riboflavin synthase